MRRPGGSVLIALIVCAAVAGCGKRGDPLPPLRPVPAAVTQFDVRRGPAGAEIALVVPDTNADETTPPAISRVDVFARTVPAGTPPPAVAQLMGDPENLFRQLTVREAEAPETGLPTVVPGERVVLTDTTFVPETPSTSVRYYVAVGVAGTGAGRRGRPSRVVAMPLGDLPPAPAAITLTYDETSLHVTWEPAAAGQRFEVYRMAPSLDPATTERLTPTAIQTTTFDVPVTFGERACFSVGALVETAGVTLAGMPSPAQCVLPVDTYPPPAPTGVRVVAEGGAITVLWDPVDASDLAGYVVLRGGADGGELTPLFRDPIATTTFRDTTVVAGQVYAYAVYAVDRSDPPNVSQLSDRQSATAR